ncbi:LCP family glycopolymer transferase [Enterococcus camelliae]|uniref:LCP family protein n=1 Tax=Enterococcus camelliae TaxID=453959 RepID=A0ABW5TJZ3_9ENTE
MQIFRKVLVGVLALGIVLVTAATAYAAHLYNTTSTTFDDISKTISRKTDMRTEDVSIEDSEPFSILLMGIDTGALGRTEQGRSDSMMVVTVNPKTKQSTIVSLDRDILTNIVGYEPNGTAYFDKLNHAYAFGSVDMAMDTIESLLDIPLDHYVSINMEGLSDLIDAVGGIEVDNKIDFTLDGVHVPVGKQKLNGKTGLAYSRMRHEDPEGDIGRQKRQREVVEKILRKVLSMDSITNYQKILNAVKKNVLTDLSFNEMLTIGKNYTAAFDTVKSYQLQGESQTINEVYYQILGVNELLSIQNILKKQLNLSESSKLVINQDFYYSSNGLLGDQFYDDTDYNQVAEAPYEYGDKSTNTSTSSTENATDDSDEVADNTNQ